MQSTSMLTPTTSEARMNSCRLSVDCWPVRVNHSIAVIHSCSLGSMSRTNACRCLIIDCMIWRSRGSGTFVHRSRTISVMLLSVTWDMEPPDGLACGLRGARSDLGLDLLRRPCQRHRETREQSGDGGDQILRLQFEAGCNKCRSEQCAGDRAQAANADDPADTGRANAGRKI